MSRRTSWGVLYTALLCRLILDEEKARMVGRRPDGGSPEGGGAGPASAADSSRAGG
ncbi:hypothetical protein I8J29_10115 [Paenibacillus sp. MWE-103]|uniref:Uncharacterized protein n=1 Tax=Paenibacillus artemisiicola TaxID=1172618 RepID=A0ABS3W8E0_9BACL|nr:hypothetical protein [Paenibacillus artemisiicola]MBO7744552.1 hypothetical protein [Paenibacillus artemisiicola]